MREESELGEAPAGEDPAGEEPAALDATADAALVEEGAGGQAPEEEGAVGRLERGLAEANDRYLRLAADFDNYRKRMLRERVELMASSKEDLVLELLPVADNLERAVASVRRNGEADASHESIVKGVELTLRMFQGILGRYGVQRMTAVGETFDPHRHEALMQEESEDVAVDTVVEEMEPGYVMRDKVVRPARVKVRKPKTAAGLDAQEGGGREAGPGESGAGGK